MALCSSSRRDLDPRDSPRAVSSSPTSQGGSSNGVGAEVATKTKEADELLAKLEKEGVEINDKIASLIDDEIARIKDGVKGYNLEDTKSQIHHELRPSLSSSSSSSTSARSSQTRMAPHQWGSAEELSLFDAAQALLDAKVYINKIELNRDIADSLNNSFPDAVVPFTGAMVKAKLALFKEKWVGQVNIAPEDRKLYTTRSNLLITGHQATFEALFTDESTNSGAQSELGGSGPVNFSSGSVSMKRKRKEESPPEVKAAIAFMAAGDGKGKRSTGRELLIFAAMLNDVPYLLETFNALPNKYEERRSALIDVFKFGGPGVPEIPRDKLPVDFL